MLGEQGIAMLEPGKIYQVRNKYTFSCYVLEGHEEDVNDTNFEKYLAHASDLQSRDTILVLKIFRSTKETCCRVLNLKTNKICYIFDRIKSSLFELCFKEFETSE